MVGASSQVGLDQRSIESHREHVARLAAAGDKVARAQLDAWAHADTPEPTSGMAALIAAMPATAKIAASGARSVFNPKIWDEDLKRWRGRRFSIRYWLGVCGAVIDKTRSKGDVERRTIFTVCKVLEHDTRQKQDGKVENAFERIPERARC